MNVIVKDGNFAADVDFGMDLSNAPAMKLKTEVAQGGSGFMALGEPTRFDAKAVLAGVCWDTEGNAGTNSLTSFIGTTDSQAFEIRTRNARSLRIEPSDLTFGVPALPITTNTIGGSRANTVTAGIRGATIAGGGAPVDSDPNLFSEGPNSVTGPYGTVGGGSGNVAGNLLATVGGGDRNAASGEYSIFGGGNSNSASGLFSTVVGGSGNSATGGFSTVSGGSNCAGGDFSWAGGRGAKVRPGNQVGDGMCATNSGDANGDNGTFVWADSQLLDPQDQDFVSTGPNQFLVRAGGGMAINTNIPTGGGSLTVAPLPSGTNSTIAMTGVGDSKLISLSGDLKLDTGTSSKYIYTNDRFGVNRRPTANALEVAGDASKNTAGAWLANSDRRIKSDIAAIPNALDRLSALRPVTFHYTPEYLAAHPGIKDISYYNVIAQEFQTVFPDAVKGSGEYLAGKAQTPEHEILQVDTYPAQILAIAAIQELNAKLELENTALRQELTAIHAAIKQLQADAAK
jgi:trimeric autotransporter adhesin